MKKQVAAISFSDASYVHICLLFKLQLSYLRIIKTGQGGCGRRNAYRSEDTLTSTTALTSTSG